MCIVLDRRLQIGQIYKFAENAAIATMLTNARRMQSMLDSLVYYNPLRAQCKFNDCYFACALIFKTITD